MERSLRILHIDTGAGWRGGQQQVLWLMEALRAGGCEQLLLAPAGSPLSHRIRKTGLPVAPTDSARDVACQPANGSQDP